jgi:hypothetical protein
VGVFLQSTSTTVLTTKPGELLENKIHVLTCGFLKEILFFWGILKHKPSCVGVFVFVYICVCVGVGVGRVP